MIIGPKTLQDGCRQIESLLNYWHSAIDEAYRKSDDNLAVGLKLNLKPGKEGGTNVKAEINFISDRVKDATAGHTIFEDQISLFEEKEKPRDRRGPVGRPPRFKGLGG